MSTPSGHTDGLSLTHIHHFEHTVAAVLRLAHPGRNIDRCNIHPGIPDSGHCRSSLPLGGSDFGHRQRSSHCRGILSARAPSNGLFPELTLRRSSHRHHVVARTTGSGRSNLGAVHPDNTNLHHGLGGCSRRRNGHLGNDPTFLNCYYYITV